MSGCRRSVRSPKPLSRSRRRLKLEQVIVGNHLVLQHVVHDLPTCRIDAYSVGVGPHKVGWLGILRRRRCGRQDEGDRRIVVRGRLREERDRPAFHCLGRPRPSACNADLGRMVVESVCGSGSLTVVRPDELPWRLDEELKLCVACGMVLQNPDARCFGATATFDELALPTWLAGMRVSKSSRANRCGCPQGRLAQARVTRAAARDVIAATMLAVAVTKGDVDGFEGAKLQRGTT